MERQRRYLQPDHTLGLFKPRSTNKKEKEQYKNALNEMKEIVQELKQKLDRWETKYKKLGARDTASRDAVFEYVAKYGLSVEWF